MANCQLPTNGFWIFLVAVGLLFIAYGLDIEPKKKPAQRRLLSSLCVRSQRTPVTGPYFAMIGM